MSKIPVLGYWDDRCYAEPIRLLLHYIGTEFEDRRHIVGDAPDFDKTEWLETKRTIPLDFPNLPYYIDGDVKLTQTVAIMRHIARKHSMIPTNANDQSQLDMIEQEARDFHCRFVFLCYEPGFEKNKVAFENDWLPQKLDLLSRFLVKQGNQWMLGSRLTHADFIFYEAFDELLAYDSQCLGNVPNLKSYHSRFQELLGVKEYLNSSAFLSNCHKIFNRYYCWGSDVAHLKQSKASNK